MTTPPSAQQRKRRRTRSSAKSRPVRPSRATPPRTGPPRGETPHREAAGAAAVAPRASADGPALGAAVRIVYADRELVVAEKPAGMATVRYEGPDAPRRRRGHEPPVLDEVVARLLAQRDSAGAPGSRGKRARPKPLRIVQRLDLGTSGLVVFARTVPAERGLGAQFRKHSVRRSYVAVVHGDLAAPRRFDSLLVENRGDGLRGSHPSRGKRAITHARPIERFGAFTLVECRLETGRTHQIRIHLAEAGHPLCGETLYHRPRFGQAAPDASGAPRIMLHAGELGFRHPLTEAALNFTMEPPEDFREFVERLRMRR